MHAISPKKRDGIKQVSSCSVQLASPQLNVSWGGGGLGGTNLNPPTSFFSALIFFCNLMVFMSKEYSLNLAPFSEFANSLGGQA